MMNSIFLFKCEYYHDVDEYSNMISYFENPNHQFKRLPNSYTVEKWNYISDLTDLHANYLCSFVTKGFLTRKTLIN